MNLVTLKFIDHYIGGLLILLFKPFVMLLGLILKRDHSIDPKNEIVFLKLLGGGSLTMAIPAIEAVKEKYPDIKIVLVTTKGVSAFANLFDVFDEVSIIDDSSLLKLVKSSAIALRKNFLCDSCIDLEAHSKLSTIFSTVTMARNRVGFYKEHAFWRRNLHTHLIYFNSGAPSFVFYDEIARLFGVVDIKSEDSWKKFRNKIAKSAFSPPNKAYDRIICIGHGCSPLCRERELLPSQWDIVFKNNLKSKESVSIIFLGAAKDYDLAENITDVVKSNVAVKEIINYCGKLSLIESLKVLQNADAFWGIDSALLHFARYLLVPSVSFWGPSKPDYLLRPIDGLIEQNHYNKLPCSPCIHITNNPPCKGDNICIQNLFLDDANKRRWKGLIQ